MQTKKTANENDKRILEKRQVKVAIRHMMADEDLKDELLEHVEKVKEVIGNLEELIVSHAMRVKVMAQEMPKVFPTKFRKKSVMAYYFVG